MEATNLWTFFFAADFNHNYSQSTPAIAPDGNLYVGSFDGNLYAVTPEGKKKWQFKAEREIKSALAIADDGTIYFGSRDRFFYAVTPDGQLKWRFVTGGWVDSSPALAVDGTIYFGSWDKTFYALHPGGSLKWKLAIGAIVDSSPAIAVDGTIYFGAHDKKLYALNPDGTVRWTFMTGEPIISSPAIGAAGTIYFTSLDGNLYAVNPDGTEQWRYHTGGSTDSSPVLDENENVCLPANNNTLFVTKTGKLHGRWPSSVFLEIPPAIAGGRIYVSRPWREVHCITADMKCIWTIKIPSNLTTPPMLDNQGIIYACVGRFLHAIRPPGEPLPPAKSSWPMFRADARHTGRVQNCQPSAK